MQKISILLQSPRHGWMKVFMTKKFYHLDMIFIDETEKADVVEPRGGILLATKNHMTSFRRYDLESDCEIIWVEITTNMKLLFGVFYRPPNTDIQYLRSLRSSLDRVNNTKAEKIFLVGDFNLPNFNSTNQLPCSFKQIYIETFEMLNDAFLTQVDTEPTRNDNILDLILTNFPDLIPELSVIENFVDSDHRSVFFKIKTGNNYKSAGKRIVFNYKKANWEELKRTLSYIPWHVAMLDEDINQNLIKCEDLLWAAINEFIPTKQVKSKHTPPWIDREVKNLCRKKDQTSRKALRTKNPAHVERFNQLRRDVKRLINKKYQAYLTTLADSVQSEPKKLWSFYSVKTNSKRIPNALKRTKEDKSPVTNSFDKANMFNEFFNSVFNNSSNEPEIPGTHEPVLKDLGQLSEVYVQVSDVKKSLCDLQVSKSPGPDELTARLLKELSNEISEPFTKIMNLSLQQGVFPTK